MISALSNPTEAVGGLAIAPQQYAVDHDGKGGGRMAAQGQLHTDAAITDAQGMRKLEAGRFDAALRRLKKSGEWQQIMDSCLQ